MLIFQNFQHLNILTAISKPGLVSHLNWHMSLICTFGMGKLLCTTTRFNIFFVYNFHFFIVFKFKIFVVARRATLSKSSTLTFNAASFNSSLDAYQRDKLNNDKYLSYRTIGILRLETKNFFLILIDRVESYDTKENRKIEVACCSRPPKFVII